MGIDTVSFTATLHGLAFQPSAIHRAHASIISSTFNFFYLLLLDWFSYFQIVRLKRQMLPEMTPPFSA